MGNRTKYAVIIGLGFAIAVIAGLWVAVQVSAGFAFGSVIGTALIAFVPSAILVGYGAYGYIIADQPPDEIPHVDVRHQRELVDLIHLQGAISITEAAQKLDISENDVRDAVRQLLELQIFTGWVDWNEDMLYSQRTRRLD